VLRALPKADEFIRADSGACLWGATIKYLGYVGATSRANARKAFTALDWALHNVPKQIKNVLESFLRVLDQADEEIRARIAHYAAMYAQDEKPSIRTLARKIQKSLGGEER
jgi:hypothetical protein